MGGERIDRSKTLPIHRFPCDCQKGDQCGLLGGRCTVDNGCQLYRYERSD
jgi:hypothetical protein